MKKIIAIIICLVILFTYPAKILAAQESPKETELFAKAAVLMDGDSGRVGASTTPTRREPGFMVALAAERGGSARSHHTPGISRQADGRKPGMIMRRNKETDKITKALADGSCIVPRLGMHMLKAEIFEMLFGSLRGYACISETPGLYVGRDEIKIHESDIREGSRLAENAGECYM